MSAFKDPEANSLIRAAVAQIEETVKVTGVARLAGGFSGTRVYRVMIGERSVVARIGPVSGMKRELRVFQWWSEGQFPIDGVITLLSREVVDNGRNGVLLYSDIQYSSGLRELTTVRDSKLQQGNVGAFAETLRATLAKLRQLGRSRDRGHLSLRETLVWFEGKWPPALTLRFVRQVDGADAEHSVREVYGRSLRRRQGAALGDSLVIADLWRRTEDGWSWYTDAEESHRYELLDAPQEYAVGEDLHLVPPFEAEIVGSRVDWLDDLRAQLAPDFGASSLSPMELFGDSEDPINVLRWLEGIAGGREVLLYWPSTTRHRDEPTFRTGFMHGDLHGGNILTSSAEEELGCLGVIDFEMAERRGVLAHDTGRLEVDLLLAQLRRGSDLKRFERLQTVLRELLLSSLAKSGTQTLRTLLGKALMPVREHLFIDSGDDLGGRIRGVVQHLWGCFFNALKYASYPNLPLVERRTAWLLVLLYGAQASDPIRWLCKSAPEYISPLIDALSRPESRALAFLHLDWLPTIASRLGPASPPTQRIRRMVITQLLSQLSQLFASVDQVEERFVPLKAKSGAWYFEKLLQARTGDEEKQFLEEILEHRSGVVFVGEPGAGKTTFAVHLASRYSNRVPLDRTPVLVDLSLLTLEQDDWRHDFEHVVFACAAEQLSHIHYTADEFLRTDCAVVLHRLWLGGGTFLVLDSLNEVDDQEKAAFTEALRDFLAHSLDRGNRAIVLTRAHNYKTGSLGLPEYTVLQLDDSQIEDFVTRWMQHVRLPVSLASTVTNELLAEANPSSVKNFVRNPLTLFLLLSLVVPGDSSDVQNLSDALLQGRGSLFNAFITDSLDRAGLVGAARMHALQELGKMAFQLVDAGGTTELKIPRSPPWLKTLQKQRLVQGRNDSFRFCHQSVQEFFAARHLLEPENSEALERRLEKTTWDETFHIMLGFGDLVPEERKKVIFVKLRRLRAYGQIVASINQSKEHLEQDLLDVLLVEDVMDEHLPIPLRSEALAAIRAITHDGFDHERVVKRLVDMEFYALSGEFAASLTVYICLFPGLRESQRRSLRESRRRWLTRALAGSHADAVLKTVADEEIDSDFLREALLANLPHLASSAKTVELACCLALAGITAADMTSEIARELLARTTAPKGVEHLHGLSGFDELINGETLARWAEQGYFWLVRDFHPQVGGELPSLPRSKKWPASQYFERAFIDLGRGAAPWLIQLAEWIVDADTRWAETAWKCVEHAFGSEPEISAAQECELPSSREDLYQLVQHDTSSLGDLATCALALDEEFFLDEKDLAAWHEFLAERRLRHRLYVLLGKQRARQPPSPSWDWIDTLGSAELNEGFLNRIEAACGRLLFEALGGLGLKPGAAAVLVWFWSHQDEEFLAYLNAKKISNIWLVDGAFAVLDSGFDQLASAGREFLVSHAWAFSDAVKRRPELETQLASSEVARSQFRLRRAIDGDDESRQSIEEQIAEGEGVVSRLVMLAAEAKQISTGFIANWRPASVERFVEYLEFQEDQTAIAAASTMGLLTPNLAARGFDVLNPRPVCTSFLFDELKQGDLGFLKALRSPQEVMDLLERWVRQRKPDGAAVRAVVLEVAPIESVIRTWPGNPQALGMIRRFLKALWQAGKPEMEDLVVFLGHDTGRLLKRHERVEVQIMAREVQNACTDLTAQRFREAD